MMSFRNDKLTNMAWTNETLQLIGKIQEYKGKQELFKASSSRKFWMRYGMLP